MAYFSLFLSGFIAATLFPASSEVLLLFLMSQDLQLWGLWLAATTGNTLGSCVNWYLGKTIRRFQHKRWFPASPERLAQAEQLFCRFGYWSLLFSWLPVVGDPLTLIAGVLDVRFKVFLLLVALGKALRYALLIGLGNLIW